MNRRRGEDIGSVAAYAGDWSNRENLGCNRNGSGRAAVTQARMRRQRGCSVMKGKVGQCHLGQDQDDGEQRQFENQD